MSGWLGKHTEGLKKAGFELEPEGEHTVHIKHKGKRVGSIQNTLAHVPHFDVEGVRSLDLANHLKSVGSKVGKSSEGAYKLPKPSQHTEEEDDLTCQFKETDYVDHPHPRYEPQEGHRVRIKKHMTNGGKYGTVEDSPSRGIAIVRGVKSKKSLGYYHHSDLMYHKDDLPRNTQHTEDTEQFFEGNKVNKDDPRRLHGGFLKDNPSKHYAHGLYEGADHLDTNHFHDKLVAAHGGSSGSRGDFSIPHKNVEAFHKAAKAAGYEHGKHYSLASQHTEVEEPIEETEEQYAEGAPNPIRNKPIKKRTYLEQLKAGGKPPYGHAFGR